MTLMLVDGFTVNQVRVRLPLVIGLLCSLVAPVQADLGVTEIPIIDAQPGNALTP